MKKLILTIALASNFLFANNYDGIVISQKVVEPISKAERAKAEQTTVAFLEACYNGDPNEAKKYIHPDYALETEYECITRRNIKEKRGLGHHKWLVSENKNYDKKFPTFERIYVAYTNEKDKKFVYSKKTGYVMGTIPKLYAKKVNGEWKVAYLDWQKMMNRIK